jgi:hypothetical protein
MLRAAFALAGPFLIFASVLFAMRGFAFTNALTNQHPDILSFWLPRSCLLGRSLAAGHVPLWNPFEMAGVPFAADPQSGWLYLPSMLTSWALPCGEGLRAFIVLNPLLAGLGLYWFLRKEGLHRVAATAGGLSFSIAIAASFIAVSLPFAGTLAWTPFVLVGASGFWSAVRWSRRLGWAALAAVAWGQVANAHMSHGLAMCTGVVMLYLAACAIRDARGGKTTWRRALAMIVGFLAFLPLANLATFVPRFALIGRSSLHGSYAALAGTVASSIGTGEPVPTHGMFAGWPFSLATTPGVYVGAAILLAVPAAFRSRERRYLATAFGAAGLIAYLLTLTFFVGAGWFRAFVLRVPFGDVYLHNPDRLRYLLPLIAAVLGAIGVQGFLDRSPSRREVAWWLGAAAVLSVAVPLALGAHLVRFILVAAGVAVSAPVLFGFARGRSWARVALPVVLAVDLSAGALWSSIYQGGTEYTGLEGSNHPALVTQPLRYPNAPLDTYLRAGPIAAYLQDQGTDYGRYLAWIPPAVYFNKGYIFTQREFDWPALLLGRAVLFRIDDVLGYTPVQLPRYYEYVRASNDLPVFYNASVLQLPTAEDVRVFGIRSIIVPRGVPLPPGLTGAPVAAERSYVLYEVDPFAQRASMYRDWSVADRTTALRDVLTPGFSADRAVVEEDPGIAPTSGGSSPMGSATYREASPEDVRVTVKASMPSILVVRNAWDEGWTATVDGEPTPVLHADFVMQGVAVPAGTHEVRLTYRDPSIGRGLAASGMVWLVFLFGLGFAVVRERRQSPVESDAGAEAGAAAGSTGA